MRALTLACAQRPVQWYLTNLNRIYLLTTFLYKDKPRGYVLLAGPKSPIIIHCLSPPNIPNNETIIPRFHRIYFNNVFSPGAPPGDTCEPASNPFRVGKPTDNYWLLPDLGGNQNPRFAQGKGDPSHWGVTPVTADLRPTARPMGNIIPEIWKEAAVAHILPTGGCQTGCFPYSQGWLLLLATFAFTDYFCLQECRSRVVLSQADRQADP